MELKCQMRNNERHQRKRRKFSMKCFHFILIVFQINFYLLFFILINSSFMDNFARKGIF